MPVPNVTSTGQQAAARRRLGLDPACFALLQCDCMAPRSGFDTTLLGIALLRRQHGIDATLVLAADDRDATADKPDTANRRAVIERTRLRQLAIELGIDARIHWLASPDDGARRDCLAASDVFVNMAWHALPGWAERDALAWRRPVIGTALPGRRDQGADALVDGVTGWLIAPRDAQALADRLARLRRRPDLACGGAQAARGRVRS